MITKKDSVFYQLLFLFIFLCLSSLHTNLNANELSISCRVHPEHSGPQDEIKLYINSFRLIKEDDGCFHPEHNRHLRLQVDMNWTLFLGETFGLAVHGIRAKSIHPYALYMEEKENRIFEHTLSNDPKNQFSTLELFSVYTDGTYQSQNLEKNKLTLAIEFKREEDLYEPEFFIKVNLLYQVNDTDHYSTRSTNQVLHCSTNY